MFCVIHQLRNVAMTRPSAKRKAYCMNRRQNAMKRWKKEDSESLPGGSGATPSTSHVFPSDVSHVSAASYRHSLLPEANREAKDVSEHSAIACMSVQRLLDILKYTSCPDWQKMHNESHC